MKVKEEGYFSSSLPNSGLGIKRNKKPTVLKKTLYVAEVLGAIR